MYVFTVKHDFDKRCQRECREFESHHPLGRINPLHRGVYAFSGGTRFPTSTAITRRRTQSVARVRSFEWSENAADPSDGVPSRPPPPTDHDLGVS